MEAHADKCLATGGKRIACVARHDGCFGIAHFDAKLLNRVDAKVGDSSVCNWSKGLHRPCKVDVDDDHLFVGAVYHYDLVTTHRLGFLLDVAVFRNSEVHNLV